MKEKGPLWKSFYYAFSGIVKGIVAERNMFIHFTIMCLVIMGGFFFHINSREWLIIIMLIGLVLSLELVNTAIEYTVDICSPGYSEKAKTAKDTAAGAVLIAVIIAVVNGLIIFLPKVIDFLSTI